MEKYPGQYLMLVEGSIPTGADGVYCCIAGRSALDIVKEAAAGAKALVAWGSCASNGCIQAANPNPTGATPLHKIVSGKPIIKVPGCPPIGDVMAAVVVHLLAFDRIPQLDALGRPKAFYSKRVHDTCIRRASYDAGLFVESWDDEGAAQGYCLYKMGCRGPDDLQRVQRHPLERGTSATRSSPDTAASVAAKRSSGTTAPSTSTCRPSRASASSRPPIAIGMIATGVTAAGHRRPRGGDQRPQAQGNQAGVAEAGTEGGK